MAKVNKLMRTAPISALAVAVMAAGVIAPPAMAPDASNAVLASRNNLGVQPAYKPVSLFESYPFAAQAAGRNTKKGAATSRLWTQLTLRSATSAIEVCYSNINGGAVGALTTEVDGSNDMSIAAGVEVNTGVVTGTWATNSATRVLLKVQFKGLHLATLTAGTPLLCSDPVYFPFAAGQNIYVWTYYNYGSGTYPMLRGFNGSAAFSEWTNDNFFTGAKLGTSTTATTSISGTLTGTSTAVTLPIVPGTVSISGGTITGYAADTDNGNGTGAITGTGVSSGTITYATGAVTMTLATATAPNNLAAYGYGNSGTAPTDDTLTMTSTYTSTLSNGSGVYGPSLILGLPAITSQVAPLSLCTLGDSIDYGSGNTAQPGQSWVNYANTGGIGLAKVAQPSETAASFAQGLYSHRRLSVLAQNCSRFIDNYGTNDDFTVGFTLAQFQAAKLAIWAQLATMSPLGYKAIYPVSILPRTTGNTTTPLNSNFGSGSVASGSPSLRNAENAWMCAQVAALGLGGFIDTAAAVEGNPASCAGAGDGTWKSASIQYDYTHPSQSGYQAIAAMIGYGGINPSPAFVP